VHKNTFCFISCFKEREIIAWEIIRKIEGGRIAEYYSVKAIFIVIITVSEEKIG